MNEIHKMKKNIKSIILFTTLVILIASCKKSNSSNTSNSTIGNFTLKYEVITSSPITQSSTFQFENATQQNEWDYNFTSGTTWTKEVTVTTPNRPFSAILVGGATIGVLGTVTSNIYVNGNQVAHVTNQATQQGLGIYGATIWMQYIIQ